MRRYHLVLCSCCLPCVAGQGPAPIGIVNNEAFDGPTELQAVPDSLPADNSIAVSPVIVGIAMNGLVVFYDRTDNFTVPEEGIATLQDFFDLQVLPFDPRIVYDAGEDRFVACTLGGGLHVAWSDVGDPVPLGLGDKWTGDTASPAVCDVACNVTAPEDLRLDMPALGFDDLAWYVSARTQGSGNSPCPDGADRIVIPHYIIPKPPPGMDATQIIDPIFSNEFIDDATGLPLACFRQTGPAEHAEITTPAIHYGVPPATYFVGIASPRPLGTPPPGCPPNHAYELRILAIVDPLAQNRDLRAIHLPIPCFDPRNFHFPTPSGDTVEAVDGYVASAIWQDGSIWAAHSIVKMEVLAGSTAIEKKVVRWYEIATNGWPASGQDPTLAQWGEIEGPSSPVAVHLFVPALNVNEDGEVALIMARASSIANLSIQATGRFEDSPAGTMFPLTTIKGSNTGEVPDSNSWGDYFTVVPDPSGDGTFWGFAMYMIDNVEHPESPTPLDPDDDGFGTWIFHFILLGP